MTYTRRLFWPRYLLSGELDILLAAPATPKGWPLPPRAGEKAQKNQDALINRVSGHSWWKTWKLHLGANPVWVVILFPPNNLLSVCAWSMEPAELKLWASPMISVFSGPDINEMMMCPLLTSLQSICLMLFSCVTRITWLVLRIFSLQWPKF